MAKDNRGGIIGFSARCLRAAWRELISRPQVYAQIAAGPVNAGILIWVIAIVAEPRWREATQQLQILMWLGIIAALTNAVVVIALSRVNVQAHGPGNLSFDVGSGGDTAAVQATATVAIKPAGETS